MAFLTTYCGAYLTDSGVVRKGTYDFSRHLDGCAEGRERDQMAYPARKMRVCLLSMRNSKMHQQLAYASLITFPKGIEEVFRTSEALTVPPSTKALCMGRRDRALRMLM